MSKVPRALVIAIENYPDAKGLARELPGTLDAGDKFIGWITGKKGISPTCIVECRNEKATRKGILDSIEELVKAGRDKTSELYFFFSGHGFGIEESLNRRALDILVASDFTAPGGLNPACIKLDELQDKLYLWLGGDDHYFFVDACRNIVPRMVVPDMGGDFPAAELGFPTVYTIYSAVPGASSKLKSGFPQLLLGGLEGAGHAKGRHQGTFYVKFDLLAQYLHEKLKQRVDPQKRGDGLGLILKLKPPVRSDCAIVIENAAASDKYNLEISTGGGFSSTETIVGSTWNKPLDPNDAGYYFQIRHQSKPILQIDPPPDRFLDLYDPVTLKFRKGPAEEGEQRPPTLRPRAPRPPAPKPATMPPTIGKPPTLGVRVELTSVKDRRINKDLEIKVHNLRTGDVYPARRSFARLLKPGTYRAEVLHRGVRIQSSTLKVSPGKRIQVDLLKPVPSRVLDSILEHLPNREGGRITEFSKSLGPTPERDIGLWLTLLGASKILCPADVDPKLSSINLNNFDGLRKDQSVVYILTGLERGKAPRFAISERDRVKWSPLRKVPKVRGVYEGFQIVPSGTRLLSLALPDAAVVTYAMCAMPNRATFVVVAGHPDGTLTMNQFLFPIHSLSNFLPPDVYSHMPPSSLETVRWMYKAQSKFSRREGLDLERSEWNNIFYGKWLEPLLSLIAAFELIRRGEMRERAHMLQTVSSNLKKYFSEIPDSLVLAKRIGHEKSNVSGTPLLRESLLTLSDYQEIMPLSADHLDHSSIWTCWTNAVHT